MNFKKLANKINTAMKTVKRMRDSYIISGGLIKDIAIIKPILEKTDYKNVIISNREERPVMGAVRLVKLLEGNNDA